MGKERIRREWRREKRMENGKGKNMRRKEKGEENGEGKENNENRIKKERRRREWGRERK